MDSKENFKKIEVAVVGGGPAGAWCAFMLARAGAGVSLIHWSGYAPGGIELVSGRARRLIEHHCPGFFERTVSGVEVRETISLGDMREPIVRRAMSNSWRPGVAVERPLLDRALRDLAQAAGAEVLADAKVMEIERRDDNWELSLRLGEDNSSPFHATFVVLATGRAATPFLDRPVVPESSKLALMTPLSAQNDESRHALYIESTSSGCWYALPAPNGSTFAGFCLERAELKKREGSLKNFFVEELCRTKLLAPLLPGDTADLHISGRMADARSYHRAVGEGWLAIGDAVYAPDPLNAMGIELAIESAQLGARTVRKAMRPSMRINLYEAEVLAEYDAVMRERAQEYEKAAHRYC